MEAIKIAVIEDQKENALQLQKYLNAYFSTTGLEIEISYFCKAEDFLKCGHKFDVVFMDIELPGIDGLTASKKLRERDDKVIIVFITNMAQLAIRGYEVKALDYIVKPLIYSDFAFKLRRIERELNAHSVKKITVTVNGAVKIIEVNELLYVEVSGHKIIWHLKDDLIEQRASLSQYEQALISYGLLRCNRCYLVNPEHIKKIDGYNIFIGDDCIQISRPQKKAFMQQLNTFILGGGSNT